jgi:RNA polymerase sigma-70 factor (ECF subfamily)
MQVSKDEELIELLRAGNVIAFTALMEQYQELLFMVAMKYLHDDDEAKDAVQETFIWVWEKRSTLQIHSSVRNYLIVAVRNCCLNIIRRANATQKRKDQYKYIKDTVVISKEIETKELGIILNNAISNMAPARRTVFEMHYIDDYSQKEIATQKGISLQTVKNQVVTALKELRFNLREWHN